MYHSILVPLDGSPFAEQALPLALRIADLAGASLEIMHVHQLYGLCDAFYSWSPYYPALDVICQKQALAYLDAVRERLKKTAAVPVTSTLICGAMIAERLVERARTMPAGLIVMATHGRNPMSRFWLGSVADELVRRASLPILLVHPGEVSANSEREPTWRRILVPLDGSELAEQGLEPAVALGSLMDAEYVLLRVVGLNSPPIGAPLAAEMAVAGRRGVEQRKAEAPAYLDELAECLRAKGCRVQTHLVIGESPAAIVLDVARGQKVDLIAIATHGHGGIKRFLLGSVADTILRGTYTPVLVNRPTTNEYPQRS